MIGRLVRILIGFVLASLAAGLATVSFVVPPTQVLGELGLVLGGASADQLMLFLRLVLSVAVQTALFGGTFVLIGVLFAEWRQIGSLTYYLLLSLGVALLGFATWYVIEPPGDVTIVNNYALTAFLTSGFLAGLVYWLISGRFAGFDLHDGPLSSERRRNGAPETTVSDMSATGGAALAGATAGGVGGMAGARSSSDPDVLAPRTTTTVETTTTTVERSRAGSSAHARSERVASASTGAEDRATSTSPDSAQATTWRDRLGGRLKAEETATVPVGRTAPGAGADGGRDPAPHPAAASDDGTDDFRAALRGDRRSVERTVERTVTTSATPLPAASSSTSSSARSMAERLRTMGSSGDASDLGTAPGNGNGNGKPKLIGFDRPASQGEERSSRTVEVPKRQSTPSVPRRKPSRDDDGDA
ncbi:MAG: hypothetical protein AAFR04_11230 [Pseudomonadota bacterium]